MAVASAAGMALAVSLRGSMLTALLALAGCGGGDKPAATLRTEAAKVAAPKSAPTSDRLKWVRHDLVWTGLRSDDSLVYDEQHQTTLLFGGTRSETSVGPLQVVANTMLWDGSRWSQPVLTQEPPPRWQAAAVYDRARQVVLLFGGLDAANNPLGDSWTWDGASWTALPATGPMTPASAPTGAVALAYDAARQRDVLFITDPTSGAVQVWEWDGSAWSNLTPASGPAPTFVYTSAVYQATSGGIIVVAGHIAGTTWVWDGKNWSQRASTHAPPPGASLLVYDSTRDRVLALPGDATWCWQPYEWNGSDWAAPAIDSCNADAVPMWSQNQVASSVTYDQARQAVLLVGNSSGLDGATWSLKSGSWTRLDAGRPWPQIGYDTQRITYDGKRDRLILADYNQPEGMLWEFDGSHWRVSNDSFATLAYSYGLAADSARGRTILLGGFTNDHIHQTVAAARQTCEWDGTQSSCAAWAISIPDVHGRDYAGLAYDSDKQRTIIFGGATCVQIFASSGAFWNCTPQVNATDAYDGTSYTQLDDGTGTAPAARLFHGMAYDSGRKRVVVFGGSSGPDDAEGTASPIGDTWEFDGAHWSEAHPAHSPSPRFGAALYYDALRARTVLFGGTSNDGVESDVWEWDGIDWLQRTPSNSPGAFGFPDMTYDSTRQHGLLYGAPGTLASSPNQNRYGDGTLWSLEVDPGSAGDSCQVDPECGSGHCVDHVCCNSACGGNDTSDCQACSVIAGATADGTCSPIAAGHVCRAATGICDLAEACDGKSATCPADTLAPVTTVCRATVGPCDVAEACSGSSAACPADQLVPATTVCRAAAGACDVAEVCSGASAACPADVLAAAGVSCAAAGECSAAASCSGSSAACPPSTPLDDGTACSGGSCQAGTCQPAGGVPDMGAPPDLSPPAMAPVTAMGGGCGCDVGGGERPEKRALAQAGLALLLLLWARRRFGRA
jgi:hypothetical protein